MENKSRVTIYYHGTIFVDDANVHLKKHWGRYLVDLSTSFDLTCVCFQSNQKEAFQDYALPIGELDIVHLRSTRKIEQIFEQCRVLRRVVRSSDFIYILMPSKTGLFAAVLARLLCKEYGMYFGLDPMRSVNSPVLNFLTRCALKGTRFAIGTGQQVVQSLENHAGRVVATKPNLLFNLSDITPFRFNQNGLRLIFVGELSMRKGILHLIRALSNDAVWDVVDNLTIVGDGDLRNEAETLTSALGVNDKVEFVGYVSDEKALKQAYLTANMLVLPSFEEGFPRVIYEAMIFGLGIVATPVNSIPSLVQDGVNGFLFPPGEQTELEIALIRAAKSQERLATMSQYNQELIQTIADERTSSQHARIIQKALT